MDIRRLKAIEILGEELKRLHAVVVREPSFGTDKDNYWAKIRIEEIQNVLCGTIKDKAEKAPSFVEPICKSYERL